MILRRDCKCARHAALMLLSTFTRAVSRSTANPLWRQNPAARGQQARKIAGMRTLEAHLARRAMSCNSSRVSNTRGCTSRLI